MNTLFNKDGLLEKMSEIAKVQLGITGKAKELQGPTPDGGKLLELTPKMAEYMDAAEGMASFVNAIKTPLARIIDTVLDTGLYPEDVKEAAAIMVGTAEIIRVLPDMLKGLNANLPTLLKEIDSIDKTLAGKFTVPKPGAGGGAGTAFAGAMGFIAALTMPLLDTFGDVQNINDVAAMIPAMNNLLKQVATGLPDITANLDKILASDVGEYDPAEFAFIGKIFTITDGIAAAIMGVVASGGIEKLNKATSTLDIVNQALLELAQAFHRMNGTIVDLSKVANVLKGLDGGVTANVSSSTTSNIAAHSEGDFGGTDVHTQVQMNDASNVTAAGQVGMEAVVANTGEMVRLQGLTNNLLSAVGEKLGVNVQELLANEPKSNPAKQAKTSDATRQLEGSKVTAGPSFSGRKPG
jgi:hypothetical protein